MSLVQMSVAVEPVAAEQKQKRPVFGRFGWVTLGLVVPIVFAGGWEIAVRAGISAWLMWSTVTLTPTCFPHSCTNGSNH